MLYTEYPVHYMNNDKYKFKTRNHSFLQLCKHPENHGTLPLSLLPTQFVDLCHSMTNANVFSLSYKYFIIGLILSINMSLLFK